MGRTTKGSRASGSAAVLAAVTLVGVGGVPSGVGGEPLTGLLPAAVCQRYDDLREVDDRLVAPAAFDLDHDRLSGALGEQRAIVDDLAARVTTGELGTF